MIIIVSAKMGPGTFEAKFLPLSQSDTVKQIYILRKTSGPKIDKVKYIILPRICRYGILNTLITPFYLLYYTIKLKADLILAYHLIPHAFFGFFASFLTGKRFIYAQTGGGSQELFQKKVWKPMIKTVLKKACYIIVPGNQSKSFWLKNYYLQDKVKVLHSTINIKRFSPDQQTPKDIDVLYVGALRPRKQVDKIIIAFSELIKKKSNVRLGIVGNGFLENELKSLVEDIGITENVHFFGFQKDVLPFLKRAKIFIMASKMEGLPVALMEAMACENTVIAPAVDNIPTVLIDKRTGYLMNSTSQEVVNKTLIEAYNNFHKDLHIRRSAREMIIDNYSYQSAISKWSSLLNNF